MYVKLNRSGVYKILDDIVFSVIMSLEVHTEIYKSKGTRHDILQSHSRYRKSSLTTPRICMLN